MRNIFHKICHSATFVVAIVWAAVLPAQNQTDTLSPVFPQEDLPFKVELKLDDFTLPFGWHSGVFAEHKGKWLFLAGRTNGLHGFENDNNNFPPQKQNTSVFVVDFEKGTVVSRSLEDPSSGLTQAQIDTLSVTSPQGYQKCKTLYMTGGYGIDTATGTYGTKPVLTAIDVPGLMHWVTHPSDSGTAAKHIRQISAHIFQVTGGYMTQFRGLTLLVYGQNFVGAYFDGGETIYTNQVRRFKICDDGKDLSFKKLHPLPNIPDPSFRRRDLNVVPVVRPNLDGSLRPALVAYSGVFTPDTGVWTVPVQINTKGVSFMADPASPNTFKQALNQYDSAVMNMYSKKNKDMYTVILGGLSFAYFKNGQMVTSPDIPFVNQVTTIKLNQYEQFTQYLNSTTFPLIRSTGSNPGNVLFFGTSATFIPAKHAHLYKNGIGILKLDKYDNEPTTVGYIIGGIMSTRRNTKTITDSTGSPYIFKVILRNNSE